MEEFGKEVEKFRQRIHERDRADYQVLNLCPILTLHECICGLVGIKSDVGDLILGKTHYWKIRRIADSHHDAGTLKCIQTGPLTFWPGQHHANEFMAWAKSIAINPPDEWRPITDNQPSDTLDPKSKVSVDILRYQNAITALSEMRSSDQIETATSLIRDVIPYMQDKYEESGRFSNCCNKNLENLANSIRRGGRLLGHSDGSPLKNSEYLATPDVQQVDI